MYSSLLIGLAIAVGAPAKEAPKDKDKPGIVGTWVGEKAVAGGKDLPVPDGGISFTFTEDGKVMIKEGKREKPDSGTYKLDPKKDPAEIDLTPPPDKKDDKTILGIYKVDGDTLTLCFGKESAERPTKFESPEGSKFIVITLKRAKKE